jgi:transmembrane sensor
LLSRQDSLLTFAAAEGGAGAPDDLRLFVQEAVYTLVLSDNSHVTMGKGAALHFPGHFRKQERNVELSGEAWFEVEPKQADTFRVYIVANALVDTVPVRQAEVQAVGTRFNIRAYGNEPTKRVTLDEGILRVCKNNMPWWLNAGEEMTFTLAGIPETHRNPKPEDVAAWRNRRITFTNTDVLTVMLDLERNYKGITVSVAPEVAGKKITLYSTYDRPIGYLVGFIQENYRNYITIKKENDTIYVTRPTE